MHAIVTAITLLVLGCTSVWMLISLTAIQNHCQQLPVVEDATGALRVNRPDKRLVFGASVPKDIDDYPQNAIVWNLKVQLSPKLAVDKDDDGNTIFSQTNAFGVEERKVTITKGGAIVIGQIPPTPEQYGKSGGVFINGDPDDTVVDRWHRNTQVDITDATGERVGSMHAVQHTEDPRWTGVQIAASDVTYTVTRNKVVVGSVGRAFLDSNKDNETRLLVGGNVLQQDITQQVSFSCAPIPGTESAACDTGEVRLRQFVAPSVPGNALASQVITLGYFKPGTCYNLCTGLPARIAPMISVPPDCDPGNPRYTKFNENVCADNPTPGAGLNPTRLAVPIFTDSGCSVPEGTRSITLDPPTLYDSYLLDCFCPNNEYLSFI